MKTIIWICWKIPTIGLSLKQLKKKGDGNHICDDAVIYFQQDSAPPHYAFPVRQWVDEEFPDKWIW